MPRKSGLPTWLITLLAVVGAIVLAPPLIALLFAALGVAIGVGAGLLKLAVVGLAVYLVFLLLKKVFGGPAADAPMAERLEHDVEQMNRASDELKRLDEELAQAVAASRK